MKIKHNKKRNTAFVFESLVKEITIAILKENNERKDKAISIVKKHFKPELLNRVTDIVIFNRLTEDDIEKIVDIELNKVVARIKESQPMNIKFTKALKRELIKQSDYNDCGARELYVLSTVWS